MKRIEKDITYYFFITCILIIFSCVLFYFITSELSIKFIALDFYLRPYMKYQIVILIVGLFILLFGFLLAFLNTRKFKDNVALEYVRSIPKWSPAVAGAMVDLAAIDDKKINLLLSSLYSLNIAGAIKFSWQDDRTLSLQLMENIDKAKLSSEEQYLYQWMYGERRTNSFTFDSFFSPTNLTESKKNQFLKKSNLYFIKIMNELQKENFYQKQSKIVWINVIPFLSSIIYFWFEYLYFVNIISNLGTLSFYALIGFILSLFVYFIFLWLQIKLYGLQRQKIITLEGYKKQTESLALKNFLNDYSLLAEANSQMHLLWKEYFVYAIALGVSKKAMKQLVVMDEVQLQRQNAMNLHELISTSNLALLQQKAMKQNLINPFMDLGGIIYQIFNK